MEPYPLSRSKLQNFKKCPRCFYLDRKCGLIEAPSFPFTLNIAVDHLLKKEFDTYREAQKPHPLMKREGVEAVPFSHPDINKWRSQGEGIRYLHKKTNLMIFGLVDDVWVDSNGGLFVVDYKATGKQGPLDIREEYQWQLELYQWLFRRNGFEVNETGYIVYAQAKTDVGGFNERLEFELSLLPHHGNDSWVEPTIIQAYECLKNDALPESGEDCGWCGYRHAAQQLEDQKI